jgi:hypothetical protein
MKFLLYSTLISLGLLVIYHINYGVGGLGAVSFPASLDTFTNPTATTRTNVVSHAQQHSDANDGIEALQAKVGVSSSTVQSSLAFKLKDIFGGNKAASLTGTETLTNKTLTSPGVTGLTATSSTLIGLTTLTGTTTINLSSNPYTLTSSGAGMDITSGVFSLDLGSDATGDIFYRNSSGAFTRLPIGTNGQTMQVSGGLPSWQTAAASDVLVRAYLDSDQSITSGNTNTLQFDGEDFDTGSDFSTSTYTFTTPSDGYYLVSVSLEVDALNRTRMDILVNGAASSTLIVADADPDGKAGTSKTEIFDLNTNDTVSVQVYQASTGNVYGNTTGTESVLVIQKL